MMLNSARILGVSLAGLMRVFYADKSHPKLWLTPI